MSRRRPGIRPRPSLARQLDVAARHALPAASTALLLLALGAPLGLPGQAELQGCAALGCVFFWSVHRPAAMPPVAVFLLGLLLDLLGAGPIGAGAVVLLAAHGAALYWRRELGKLGFLAVWLAFVLAGTGAAMLAWLLECAMSLQLYPPWPGVLQATLGVGLFPLLAMPLARMHRTLAEPDHA